MEANDHSFLPYILTHRTDHDLSHFFPHQTKTANKHFLVQLYNKSVSFSVSLTEFMYCADPMCASFSSLCCKKYLEMMEQDEIS
jgi:hypothetical protein